MPEIEEECIFDVAPGNIILQTQTNGDRLTISGCQFTKEMAATLAWLVNNPSIDLLEVHIKESTL
jgi:hypothetical protein